MKTLNTPFWILTAALVAISSVAFADPPPNVVDSDPAFNTAMGTGALLNLTTGSENTAVGFEALVSNTDGSSNTASGVQALYFNTTGDQNTAYGSGTLFNNTAGYRNTASGVTALFFNTTGEYNTANGANSLHRNTTGNYNTASGAAAIYGNTTGSHNAALGYYALYKNRSGFRNSAVGNNALLNNTTGRYNTAIGFGAGQKVTTGSDNILLANPGVTGDSQTMRLGKQGSAGTVGSGITQTFISGINGVTTGLAGSAVMVDANGQLGTISSSQRYKEDIQPMGSVSERLFALRPVTFRYKDPREDGSKPLQFGLVAEEVAEAFPELVVYGEDGKPETVSYHLLATILLNEYQKDHEALREERKLVRAQAARIAALEQQSEEMAHLKKQVDLMAEVFNRLNSARMAAIDQ